jgi:drug/metabolite transporter (DMT)-like permease
VVLDFMNPAGASGWVGRKHRNHGTGQFLLIRALAAAPAAILTPFTYTQIVAAVLFGMLVLGELPDPWTFVGTALIILAGLYVVRRGR